MRVFQKTFQVLSSSFLFNHLTSLWYQKMCFHLSEKNVLNKLRFVNALRVQVTIIKISILVRQNFNDAVHGIGVLRVSI